MRNICVYFVDFVRVACEKFNRFFTNIMFFNFGGGKVGEFSQLFTRFLHSFFHRKNWVLLSVIGRFIPIINIVNKNNNEIKLTFNYWRMSG